MSSPNPAAYDPAFSLLTSFSYYPGEPSALRLDRHLSRLEQAHQSLARLEPRCWCGTKEPVSTKVISDAIIAAFSQLSQDSRDPVKLVLDDRPTIYDGDPFMFVKTTNRTKYDDARSRRGATLMPSNEPGASPFDVILYNPFGEVTETSISNIAFKFSPNPERETWITPSLSSGLLAGVRRMELLEIGEIRERIITVEEVLDAQKQGTLRITCFNGVRGTFEAFLQE